MQLESSALLTGCVKKSESGKELIIRLWNPSEKKETGTLKLSPGFSGAEFFGLNEKPPGPGGAVILEKSPDSVTFELGPKKIATVRISGCLHS